MHKYVLLSLSFCLLPHWLNAKPLETEAEVKAIEKAHAAVKEIKQDFYHALAAAQKKGNLKKALPGCRVKSFDPDKITVGRTSHRLRNPMNAPPVWTKPYLDKFSKAKRSDIPKDVLTKIGEGRYGYLEPIFVEPICLNCHGNSVANSVRQVLKEEYPTDQALGFNEGDFRGLLWLEMKD